MSAGQPFWGKAPSPQQDRYPPEGKLTEFLLKGKQEGEEEEVETKKRKQQLPPPGVTPALGIRDKRIDSETPSATHQIGGQPELQETLPQTSNPCTAVHVHREKSTWASKKAQQAKGLPPR